MMLSLHPTKTSYVRFAFTLFNALEDYGGILEVIISFFGIFVMPYTGLNFNMTAMSQFYLVRSKVQDFLARGMPSKVHSEQKSKFEIPPDLDKPSVQKQVAETYPIEFSYNDVWRLAWGKCCRCCFGEGTI